MSKPYEGQITRNRLTIINAVKQNKDVLNHQFHQEIIQAVEKTVNSSPNPLYIERQILEVVTNQTILNHEQSLNIIMTFLNYIKNTRGIYKIDLDDLLSDEILNHKKIFKILEMIFYLVDRTYSGEWMFIIESLNETLKKDVEEEAFIDEFIKELEKFGLTEDLAADINTLIKKYIPLFDLTDDDEFELFIYFRDVLKDVGEITGENIIEVNEFAELVVDNIKNTKLAFEIIDDYSDKTMEKETKEEIVRLRVPDLDKDTK